MGEHVILIDDAHLFTDQDDYPGLEGIRKLVSERYPDWKFDVKDDIIRIHKPNSIKD